MKVGMALASCYCIARYVNFSKSEYSHLQPKVVAIDMGFPKIRGTLVGGPHNKDYRSWGAILKSPSLRKLPYVRLELGALRFIWRVRQVQS